MNTRTTVWLLVLCLVGLAASAMSAFVHYRLLADPTYASFCDINETWNCATVYESRYGAFRGVPIAIGGVIWFTAATLLVIVGATGRSPLPAPGRSPQRASPAESVPAYLFVLSVIGLSFVLYLGYASFVVLKTFCVLCLVTYAAVIGIFILSGSAITIAMRSLPSRALRDLKTIVRSPAALTVALLFAAGAVTAVAFFPRQSTPAAVASASASTAAPLAQEQQSEFERWYASLERVPLAVAGGGAKVVVVKFNDYQCPPCRQTFEMYKPVLAKWQGSHPGLVTMITKDYPLEPECNVHAPGGQHLAACEAAVAVRLARERGRAEVMENWLFDNQPAMTPSLVREGAREIGGVTDFDRRYASTLELVRGDISFGAQVGVRATPTFFINGVRIPGVKAEYFDAAIAYEMKRAGVK
jgi:uncharacterized membrane protein/protein-disulfide isomerase